MRTLHNEETLGALATRTLGFLSVQRGRKSKPRNEDFILCQVPGSEGVGWGAEGKRGEGARSKMLAPRELEVHWTEVVIGLPRPVPAVARWSLFPSDHHAGDRAMSITDGWGVSSSKLDVCRPWGSGWWSRGTGKRRGVPRPRRRERSQDGEPSRAWLPCEARSAWSFVNQALCRG